jgi:hypothetical protein
MGGLQQRQPARASGMALEHATTQPATSLSQPPGTPQLTAEATPAADTPETPEQASAPSSTAKEPPGRVPPTPMRAHRNGRRAAAAATYLALAYTVSSATASAEEAQGDDSSASVAVDARREARAPPLRIALDA